MKPVVLRKEGLLVRVDAPYLGDEARFKELRRATAGSMYDRRRKVTLATLDKVDGMVVRLREAEFDVVVEEELKKSLAERKIQEWNDIQAAIERMGVASTEMAKEGHAFFKHQPPGILWLGGKDRALLADDPGLGKSLMALMALPAGAALNIMCPATVKGVWRKEMNQWRPQMLVQMLKGKTGFRWAKHSEGSVINYESAPEVHLPACQRDRTEPKRCKYKEIGCEQCSREKDHSEEHDVEDDADKRWSGHWAERCILLGEHRPDCKKARQNLFIPEVRAIALRCRGCRTRLDRAKECNGCMPFLNDVPENSVYIFDEAHRMKNGTAECTVRGRALAHAVRQKGGRVWLLTGTPLMNEPTELWNVLRVAHLAEEAFGDFPTFLTLFGGKPASHGFGGYTFEEGVASQEITEKLQHVMLRRRKVDVMHDMPSKMVRYVPVEIEQSTVNACDDYVSANGGSLDNVMEELDKKLSFGTMATVGVALAKAKTAAAIALVEEYEEAKEPVVLFSAHRYPVDKIGKRKGWATITGDVAEKDRAPIIAKFQEGGLKGLAMTIGAGGVGVTLTRSAFMIFVDRSFNPELNRQAEDRSHRIGQTRPCTVSVLVAEHPLDERLTELLTKKQKLIAETVDAAREEGPTEMEEP